MDDLYIKIDICRGYKVRIYMRKGEWSGNVNIRRRVDIVKVPSREVTSDVEKE